MQAVGAVRDQPRAVQERAVAAAQIPQVELAAVAAADGSMAAADAHTIPGVGSHIHVGHSAGGGVAPSEDRLLLGFKQDRLRAFDFKPKNRVGVEHIGSNRLDDVFQVGRRGNWPSGQTAAWGHSGQAARSERRCRLRKLAAKTLRAQRGITDQAGATVFTKDNPRPISVRAIRTNLHHNPLRELRLARNYLWLAEANTPT